MTLVKYIAVWVDRSFHLFLYFMIILILNSNMFYILIRSWIHFLFDLHFFKDAWWIPFIDRTHFWHIAYSSLLLITESQKACLVRKLDDLMRRMYCRKRLINCKTSRWIFSDWLLTMQHLHELSFSNSDTRIKIKEYALDYKLNKRLI